MGSGFFLGGAAEGISDARKQTLAENTLSQDTGLRSRGLDIQQQALNDKSQRDVIERIDKQITDTMAVVGDTVKSAIEGGKDTDTIQKAVIPLVDSAKALAAKAGRDPKALDAQLNAMLITPSKVETSSTAGISKATAQISEEKALAAAGVEGTGGFTNKQQKVQAENSLRDDFLKASKDYLTVRDAKNRMDSILETGAGDIALLYSYMKILDPGSTVREGELALAQQASGVPAVVLNMYNKVVNGERLPPETRKQFHAQAEKIYQKTAEQQDKNATQFADIARRQKLDTRNVVPDLLPSTVRDRIEGATSTGIKFKVLP